MKSTLCRLLKGDHMRVLAANLKTVHLERLSASYSGFVYSPGHKAGEESVLQFLRTWCSEAPEVAATRLLGNFLIIVWDEVSKESFAFIDNAGMFPAYYLDGYISDSFRRIALELKADISIEPTHVIEFLMYGFNGGSRTLAREISRLTGAEIITESPSGTNISSKRLPELSWPQDSDDEFLLRSFGELATSVAEVPLSIDLTGGLDSRLIASYLQYAGLHYETALSAFPDHIDVNIARQVAEGLGRDFHLTPTPDESVASANELYVASDAVFGSLESLYRKGQLQRERRSRGIELSLDGTGGELYKDFWWLQDFPRYKRRNSDIERLYRLRVEPVGFPSQILTPSAGHEVNQVRMNVIREMEALRDDCNTRTYDRIYFDRMRRLPSLQNAATRRLSDLRSYSPLLEYERVRFGFNLPRWARTFDRFHRNQITTYAPGIANIRTTRGTSAAAGAQGFLELLTAYPSDLLGRGFNKASQRLRGKRIRQLASPGNASSMAESLRSSDEFHEARSLLEDASIINRKADFATVDPAFTMRALILGMFLLETEAKSSLRGD